MDGMTVASVMTTDVVVVVADTPLRELVAAMAENEVGALPVVDGHGLPIGVVSEADLLAEHACHGGVDELPHDGGAGRRRYAAEVMTSPVRAVHADEPVSYAARLLARAGLRRLFVLDRDGRLTGVVSRRDLLRVYLCGDDELGARVAELLLTAGAVPGSVEVRVDAGVVTVDGRVARRSLADAAVRMVRALPGVVGVRDDLRYAVDDVLVPGPHRTGGQREGSGGRVPGR